LPVQGQGAISVHPTQKDTETV